MTESYKEQMTMSSLLLRDWKQVVILLTPVALLPMLILSDTSEARCGYIITLMSIYYMTEALPLPVTALIPIFAFPLFGIAPTNEICMVYMRGTTMVFFGGLVVAIAVEHCNLHRRIALFVILKLGQSPTQLMTSFLVTSMFLSMWISNTAAAAMMVPIVDAILQELYKSELTRKASIKSASSLSYVININEPHRRMTSSDNNNADTLSYASISDDRKIAPPDAESKSLSVMYFLSIVYGCNLGGTSFPTGTGPNLVLWGIVASSFPPGTGLDFASWMAFNIPGMLICSGICWLWLKTQFMGWGICSPCGKVSKFSKEKQEAIERLIQKQYDALGQMTYHEKNVICLFVALVGLWVFRAPEMITGWGELVETYGIQIGSATPAVLIVFFLFVMPARLPWKSYSEDATPACITWEVVQNKLPWGLIILVGGGFAMAEGAARSGLSHWIKFQLQYLKVLPQQAIVVLVCLITTFLTEVITNITAASILLPVLRDMSISLGMHPFMLMIPVTICCSYAFMLPVSNPPNAMAYAASGMKTSDMIKTGFVLKFVCVFVIILLINTLGVVMFDLDKFPDWAVQDIVDFNIVNITTNETQMVYT